MRTPFPWAQSEKQPKLVVANKSLGAFDVSETVAKFEKADDAAAVVRILNGQDYILAALRDNLQLLEAELKHRLISGVTNYIEPVRFAVERTKTAIAHAEGWA